MASEALLRALAHPLRLALLEALSQRGEMTATQLADVVGDSPSNCSWHLRKLAEAGLVQRMAEASQRDQPWQVVQDSFEFSAEALLGPAPSVMAHRQTDRMLEAMAEGRSPAHGGSTSAWLTDHEASEIADALATVEQIVEDARQRSNTPGTQPEGARLFEFVGWFIPVDGDA